MRSDDQVIRHWAVHNNNNDLCAINTTGNWFIFYSNYLSSDTRDFPSSSISVEGVKPHQWRFCIDLISSLVQFIISRNIHFNIFNWKKYIRATRCLSKLTSALICIHGRTRLKWPIRPDRYFAFDRFGMPLMVEDSWIFKYTSSFDGLIVVWSDIWSGRTRISIRYFQSTNPPVTSMGWKEFASAFLIRC